MLLIPGFPAGEFFEWGLKYKYKTEDVATADGYEVCYDLFTKPRRELTFSIGAVGGMAYSQLSTVLTAGATICIAPLWHLRESIPYGISSGVNKIELLDVTEYKAGDFAYFTYAWDMNTHDVCKISSVVGLTIYFETPLSHDYVPIPSSGTWPYDTRACYMMPCIHGIVDHESLDFMEGLPGFQAKLKIDGGAWEGAGAPSNLVFLNEPMEAKYGAPKIVRDIQGTENGIFQLRAFESTNRLVFELTWDFHDITWREFRDFFFAAKGKANQFYLPTWMFELEITRGSDLGNTSIFLPTGYQYLYERFPRLLVKPYRTNVTPFSVVVTNFISGNEFTCEALSHETLLHDRVCFYPLARFENDELQINFKDINACQVKATFIEVLVEES